MVTISVCMIVKDEEKVLRRCLDSLKGLYDELIIVDTGSRDKTKEIAKEYTDKIYDFEWVNDFSKARNFSFDKASMDYIYMPDADEVLDEENRQKFITLKQVLDTQIEIVEMRYVNQLSNGTVYNYDKELRPKLFKRQRSFTFIEPVHEIVRLDPVVFESDIDICHMPQTLHTGRDIKIFEKAVKENGLLSKRLTGMYAKELLISGDEKDLKNAVAYFKKLSEECEDEDTLKISCIVLSKAAAVFEKPEDLMKYALKDVTGGACSETCTILGAHFESIGDLKEASVWYYNAHFETEAELNLRYKTELPLKGLCRIYEALGDFETAKLYKERLEALA